MDKKGQVTMGVILAVFMAVIVGAILFQTIAQQVGTTTSLADLKDYSITSAANGASVYITDYKYATVTSIVNATYDLIDAGNYTITNNVVYNGAEAVQVTTDAAEFASKTWLINGTAQDLTYIPSSGGRAVANLIIIFFALLVAVIALLPTYQSKILEMLGR